jgi:hypothetical protein
VLDLGQEMRVQNSSLSLNPFPDQDSELAAGHVGRNGQMLFSYREMNERQASRPVAFARLT